jgi:type VI secretion system secreted protein Hcp
MALNSYLKLTSQTQGEIKGPVTLRGRENTIEIFGWNHEVSVPHHAASGQATGKRQHQPLTIIKAVDKTTPQLYQALVTGEPITTFRLECWRAASDGAHEPYYRIELSNALIVGITAKQLDNQLPENEDSVACEDVSFVYQKIAWTWIEDNVTAEDSWASRA